jgi:hypothetical protein
VADCNKKEGPSVWDGDGCSAWSTGSVLLIGNDGPRAQ